MRTYSAIDVDLVLEWQINMLEICALLKRYLQLKTPMGTLRRCRQSKMRSNFKE